MLPRHRPSLASNIATPVGSDLTYGRVDQGVDYTSTKPYVSPGPGVVYHIGKGFAGGTGDAVYVRLDTPIVVNGRAYKELYFAETKPLVRQGQRVKAGTPITAPGSAELGFASGNGPAAPLVGGLGSGTQPTQQGNDFLSFVKGEQTYAPPNPPTQAAPATDLSAYDTTAITPTAPVQPEDTQPLVEGGIQSEPASLWQRVVQGSSSPDPMTLQYANLAGG